MDNTETLRLRLLEGLVIPACPLALNGRRHLDEQRQRAVLRYYCDAGAGGVAVGVHTTQFAIRDPTIGLFRPVLQLAAEVLREMPVGGRSPRPLGIAGICGDTAQALLEAEFARGLGYSAGLLSLGSLRESTESALIRHCREVARVLPLFGFYLQPAVGGRLLPYSFWRRFVEIENVVAIKIAPFNRYQTLDVIRAVAESGRKDIALYTGNDDNIVLDLLTPYLFEIGGKTIVLRMVGGLLGHWAVWTRRAVQLHASCRRIAAADGPIPVSLMRRHAEVTDMNAALFDAANQFEGCIPGIHEILKRQGLLKSTRCLDPRERLGRGQVAELDRISAAYPHLVDDEFVAANLPKWLS